MTEIRTCDFCHLPNSADHAAIDPACTELLRGLLGNVRAALDELTTSLTRQTRIGAGSGGRKGSERPLPFDLAASEAADALLARTVTRWAMDIWRATQSPLKTIPPTDPIAYLLARVDQIRFRGYAVTLMLELQAALDAAWATVDIAAEYVEAGLCDHCGSRLRAHPIDLMITCQCGKTYDVYSKRQRLVAEAEDRWLTAKEIERLVDVFLRTGASEKVKRRIPSGSVRAWASRGEIEMRGFGADGRSPVYRLGDVFERAYRELVAA